MEKLKQLANMTLISKVSNNSSHIPDEINFLYSG